MSDITATILMFGFCIAKGENQGFLQKINVLQLLQKGEVLLVLNKRTYLFSPKILSSGFYLKKMPKWNVLVTFQRK